MGSVALGHPQRIFSKVKLEEAPLQITIATLNPYALNALRYSMKNSCRMLESKECRTEKYGPVMSNPEVRSLQRNYMP